MANTIQIKRSLLSAAPSSLAEGEMAYVYGTDTLYLGAPSDTMLIIAGASTFAKLASPALTGTPTAPTASGATNTTQIATTAFVQTVVSGATVTDAVPTDGSTNAVQSDGVFDALALKANLASPALTGTPTAPTAANATNTTQIATTAFVKAVVSDLVNGAATSLDTLNELATALGNDANFASTVNTALGVRLITTNNLSDVSNAATARTNLGLGTMATQNANNVAITGGTIDGTTISGGTF